jgi:hypothetical protein
MGRFGSAFATRSDRVTGDVAKRHMAGRLDDVTEDVFALASSRRRKSGPCRAVAVTVERPIEGVGFGLLCLRRRTFKRRAILSPEFGRAVFGL